MVTKIFSGIEDNGNTIALYMIDGQELYIACENELYPMGDRYALTLSRGESDNRVALSVSSKSWSGEAFGQLIGVSK